MQVDPDFTNDSLGNGCGVTVDANDIYWGGGDFDDVIGRAEIDGENPDPDWITVDNSASVAGVCGVAVDADYVYWANDRGTLGRAEIDGENPDSDWVAAMSIPCGPAVDGTHIDWGSSNGRLVGRAEIDGDNPDPNFITALRTPAGSPSTRSTCTTHERRRRHHDRPRAPRRGRGNSNFVTGVDGTCGALAVDGRPEPEPQSAASAASAATSAGAPSDPAPVPASARPDDRLHERHDAARLLPGPVRAARCLHRRDRRRTRRAGARTRLRSRAPSRRPSPSAALPSRRRHRVRHFGIALPECNVPTREVPGLVPQGLGGGAPLCGPFNVAVTVCPRAAAT